MGPYVRDVTTLLHLAIDRKEGGLNLVAPQTGCLKSPHRKRNQRLNFNHVP